MICWILILRNISLLFRLHGSPNVIYHVAHIHIESSGHVVYVSQEYFAVHVEVYRVHMKSNSLPNSSAISIAGTAPYSLSLGMAYSGPGDNLGLPRMKPMWGQFSPSVSLKYATSAIALINGSEIIQQS